MAQGTCGRGGKSFLVSKDQRICYAIVSPSNKVITINLTSIMTRHNIYKDNTSKHAKVDSERSMRLQL